MLDLNDDGLEFLAKILCGEEIRDGAHAVKINGEPTFRLTIRTSCSAKTCIGYGCPDCNFRFTKYYFIQPIHPTKCEWRVKVNSAEYQFVIDHYQSMSVADMAKELGLTKGGVSYYIKKITKEKGHAA